jgi:transposase
MSTTLIEIDRDEQIDLRRQAHYWRTQHACIVAREIALKAKVQELERTLCDRDITIKEIRQQIEAMKAKLIWLNQQVFGRKTEANRSETHDESDNVSDIRGCPDEKRHRGQQEGAKGHGRKRRKNLPIVEELHELPKDKRFCLKCGKPFNVFPGTDDSEEISWEVRIYRRIHKRTRYTPSCNCGVVPGIVTAPPPGKLIPKGLFAVSFWARLIMEKFLFQMPLNRVRKMLAMEGLYVSGGTLTGGLKRIGELLQPVYTRILERSRSAKHWKMDETRWMVFMEIEGKKGYRWWLWVVITKDTVVYILDPTRSSNVPKNHLGDNPEGIINADRYSAYKALGEHILVAYCWSHVRRDFIRVRDEYKSLYSWGKSWVKRIDEIFHINNKRVKELSNPDVFQREDTILRQSLNDMTEVRDNELANPDTRKPARKALESLYKHWQGLTLFVDHPEIPMDNNESERMLRPSVMGRNSYYGSGSVWSGTLTAVLFTIFQTLLKNNVDPQKWLVSYFTACAQNNGYQPENIDAFLPWNLSPEQKLAWHYQEKPS